MIYDSGEYIFATNLLRDELQAIILNWQTVLARTAMITNQNIYHKAIHNNASHEVLVQSKFASLHCSCAIVLILAFILTFTINFSPIIQS